VLRCKRRAIRIKPREIRNQRDEIRCKCRVLRCKRHEIRNKRRVLRCKRHEIRVSRREMRVSSRKIPAFLGKIGIILKTVCQMCAIRRMPAMGTDYTNFNRFNP